MTPEESQALVDWLKEEGASRIDHRANDYAGELLLEAAAALSALASDLAAARQERDEALVVRCTCGPVATGGHTPPSPGCPMHGGPAHATVTLPYTCPHCGRPYTREADTWESLARDADTAAKSVMGWRQWQARRDDLLARYEGEK